MRRRILKSLLVVDRKIAGQASAAGVEDWDQAGTRAPHSEILLEHSAATEGRTDAHEAASPSRSRGGRVERRRLHLLMNAFKAFQRHC